MSVHYGGRGFGHVSRRARGVSGGGGGGGGGTTGPTADPGYVLLVDGDGAYLTDADGAYLEELV